MLTSFSFLDLPNLPPPYLLPWIDYQASITEKLRSKAKEVNLRLLKQDWGLPSWWDTYVLGLNASLIMKREILMSSKEHVCWYARTVIPSSTWRRFPQLFQRLQDCTLTDLIFGDNGIKRHSMINYPINAQCIEYYWLDPSLRLNQDTLWVRMSTFTVEDEFVFFLSEIFLPDLFFYCEND